MGPLEKPISGQTLDRKRFEDAAIWMSTINLPELTFQQASVLCSSFLDTTQTFHIWETHGVSISVGMDCLYEFVDFCTLILSTSILSQKCKFYI